MEIRHIAAIVGVVGWLCWQNRVKLKSLASAAIAKSSPVLSSSKAGWAAAVMALLVAFWPDISAHLPEFGNASEIRSLQETILKQETHIKELSERNQWQAEKIDSLVRFDPLTKAQDAQRAAEVAMLRDLASDMSPNTQQKLDKVVGLRDAIRLTTQSVYTDAIAEAVLSGSLQNLADEIEGLKQ
jgi:hypothetical protein